MTLTLIDLQNGKAVLTEPYSEEINNLWVDALYGEGFKVVNHDMTGQSWHFSNGRSAGFVMEIA